MSLSTIIFLLVIALILFGPEDLPVIARAMGKLIYQVRKAADELTKEFQDVVDTPKKTLNRTLDDMINPKSPKKEKIDQSEWKQEQGESENEQIDNEQIELLSYDEEVSVNNKSQEGENDRDPLSGLPEDVLTYENKEMSKKDVSR